MTVEARTRVGEIEHVEPMPLNPFLLGRVVGEEVQVDADRIPVNTDLGHEEVEEEANHGRVRIREVHRVARPRAFRPEQHATGHVPGSYSTCVPPPVLLPGRAPKPCLFGVSLSRAHAVPSIVRSERLALSVRQLDIAHPSADR
ncbi:MAG TPA: hypothetical protein VFG75_13430 [Gaiella sp.]|nr:hypothetical protein [Gaiella sp.]